jgi:hypothetical protein
VGSVVPGVLLRRLRLRGLPHRRRQHRPPLRPDRLLRPLRALPPRLLGAPRGRRAPPPVHPMYEPPPSFFPWLKFQAMIRFRPI